MSSSGIELDSAIPPLFEKVKLKNVNKYVLFNISQENKETGEKPRVVIDYQAPASSTESFDDEVEAFGEFTERLMNTPEPRFCLYDIRHVDKKGQIFNVLIYIFWCPDAIGIKKKMVYASTNNVVKKAFNGLKLYKEFHDSGDFDLNEIMKEIPKV